MVVGLQKTTKMAHHETIKNEVEANYSHLKEVMESQTRLLDTIIKYSEDQISIYDLFHKIGGLQVPTLSNTGLEFYKRNQINSIDFEIGVFHPSGKSDMNDQYYNVILYRQIVVKTNYQSSIINTIQNVQLQEIDKDGIFKVEIFQTIH